jgi:hypothetical protein
MSIIRKNSRFKIKKCLGLLVLFISCARQIAPTGGPDDKTPPAIRFSTPQKGTVNYPLKGSISIAFSEWIDKKSAEKSLSIFPPPIKGIKIKAYGKTMEIRPMDAFAESTTYHIELNSSLMDLHGNSIGTPYHFFFSTGGAIDSGKAFGCVVSSEKLSSQPKIALFSDAKERFLDSSFLETPSYVVQTDSFGNFSFENIRKGAYRCVGFLDANNDARLQPGVEQAFAPMDRSVTLDTIVGPVALFPVSSDTLTNRIISLKPLTERLLVGAWARPADSLADSTIARWRIRRLDPAPAAAAPPALKEYAPIPRTTRFVLRLTDTMTMASYQLLYSVPVPFVRNGNAVSRDSVRFNGARQADTVRPSAQGFSPTATMDLKPRIKLTWSEPVVPGAALWFMADSLKDTVKLSIARELSDSTIFRVQRPLKPDRLYRLKLPDTLFADVSGNHPRDSAFGKYSIQAVSSENLCLSLNGGAPCLPQNAKRKWLFQLLDGATRYVSGDRSGTFRFDSIAAGKGRIASFIDFNNDNVPTQGRLFPWRAPEPFRFYPDTIEARARWDIEGIKVPACEECIKKKPAPEVPAPTNSTQEKNDTLKKTN